MDKYIYDEKNGLWYELQGDYYLPCLKLPKEESRHIGVWGQRHLRYLKQHRKVLYSELLISGKLNDYLADLNEQAEEMFSRLVKQLAEKEGLTEALNTALTIGVRQVETMRTLLTQSLQSGKSNAVGTEFE